MNEMYVSAEMVNGGQRVGMRKWAKAMKQNRNIVVDWTHNGKQATTHKLKCMRLEHCYLLLICTASHWQTHTETITHAPHTNYKMNLTRNTIIAWLRSSYFSSRSNLTTKQKNIKIYKTNIVIFHNICNFSFLHQMYLLKNYIFLFFCLFTCKSCTSDIVQYAMSITDAFLSNFDNWLLRKLHIYFSL